MTDIDPSFSRRAWLSFEPLHAVVYFAPEKKDAYERAGLKGGWMGYFASRAAAMGPVPAAVVQATFFNFHPEMVARAIPDAWRLSAPARVLEARLEAVDAAYERCLADWARSEEVSEAVALLKTATERCSRAGRPLFAAHASLGWPTEDHLAVWHGCTLLREQRGDGHVAALTAAGLDGCEAHLTLVGTGGIPVDAVQPFRGWSEREWAEAAEGLRARGLLGADGLLTEEGTRMRTWIEETTDRLALEPWEALGPQRSDRLLEILATPRELVRAAGDIAYPNPMGLPAVYEGGAGP